MSSFFFFVGPTILGNDLILTHNRDQMVLVSGGNIGVFGILVVGFGVLWTVALALLAFSISPVGSNYWYALMTGIVFIMFGAIPALPRTITVVFDLDTRQVVFNTRKGRFRRKHAYSFADVAALGISRNDAGFWNRDDRSCMPMLSIKDGPCWRLSTLNVDIDRNSEILKKVCNASGLRFAPSGRWGLL
jgi:hypothetical protein